MVVFDRGVCLPQRLPGRLHVRGAAVRTRALTPTVAVLLAALFNFIGAAAQRQPRPGGQPDLDPAARRARRADHPDGGSGQRRRLGHLYVVAGHSVLLHACAGGRPGRRRHRQRGGGRHSRGRRGPVAALPGGPSPAALARDRLRRRLPAGLAGDVGGPLHASRTWSTGGSAAAQTIAAGAVAFGHGLQDGQRTARCSFWPCWPRGCPTAGPCPSGWHCSPPSMMTAGTLCGGWRISYTIGYRLTRMDPLAGLRGAALQLA